MEDQPTDQQTDRLGHREVPLPKVAILHDLRWEFIKENKTLRKQENTLSTKKATKKRRQKNFLFFFIVFLVESVFSFSFSLFSCFLL